MMNIPTILRFMLLIMLWPLTSWGQENLSLKQNQLKKLSHEIKKVQATISHSKINRDALSLHLKKTETQLSNLNLTLSQVHKKLISHKTQLVHVQTQEEKLKSQLETQKTALAAQWQAAYALHPGSPLATWLNGKNPHEIDRLLTYTQYLNASQLQQIQALKETLSSLDSAQTSLKNHQSQIEKLEAEKLAQRLAFEAARAKQKLLISSLDHNIQSQSQQLAEMNLNKKTLEHLLLQLKSRHTKSKKIFAKNQNKMEKYPNTNNNMAQFNGLFIKAPENHPVKAILPGEIVFADWLRGFGLLIIVEHSGGYMSLYAHNSTLIKRVGENVRAGEIIAKVGHSGGFAENGLYFEMRYQGKPINPKRGLAAIA